MEESKIRFVWRKDEVQNKPLSITAGSQKKHVYLLEMMIFSLNILLSDVYFAMSRYVLVLWMPKMIEFFSLFGERLWADPFGKEPVETRWSYFGSCVKAWNPALEATRRLMAWKWASSSEFGPGSSASWNKRASMALLISFSLFSEKRPYKQNQQTNRNHQKQQ